MKTVGELIEELNKYPREQKVVQAKDTEGNDFSPVADVSEGMYDEQTPYSGEIYPTPEDIAEANSDIVAYGPDDVAPEGAVRVVIFWPTN